MIVGAVSGAPRSPLSPTVIPDVIRDPVTGRASNRLARCDEEERSSARSLLRVLSLWYFAA